MRKICRQIYKHNKDCDKFDLIFFLPKNKSTKILQGEIWDIQNEYFAEREK